MRTLISRPTASVWLWSTSGANRHRIADEARAALGHKRSTATGCFVRAQRGRTLTRATRRSKRPRPGPLRKRVRSPAPRSSQSSQTTAQLLQIAVTMLRSVRAAATSARFVVGALAPGAGVRAAARLESPRAVGPSSRLARRSLRPDAHHESELQTFANAAGDAARHWLVECQLSQSSEIAHPMLTGILL